MKKENEGHLIKEVLSGSIAEELGIEPGDRLLTINDKIIKDVFDYHYQTNEEELTVVIKKSNGEEWELDIEKEYEEDLGISFAEGGLMDSYRSCHNKCIFCFIDQMPKGMRDTLYFKDDDARLSFLQGNYITLTNLSDEDMERIIYYKLSPVNVSVHTMNPELRCKMLNNRFAGDALKKLDRFKEAGIQMNGQIVLCKGYNDKEELDRTISELSNYIPNMMSVSVVPVGLTKFRDGLAKLEPFNKEDAEYLLMQIEGWQMRLYKKYGTRFIYASDEWYIKAGKPVPKEEDYEGYPQIENGVGMVRSLEDEVEEYLNSLRSDDRVRSVSLATGVLAGPVITELANKVAAKFPNVSVDVHTIINHYFGEQITVAGLLTGQDLLEQLNGNIKGDELLLPSVLLKSGENILLDDMLLKDLETSLQTKIRIVKSEGKCFVDSILGND